MGRAAEEGHPDVRLREASLSDLPAFFEHQADPGAAAMVGLPSRDRADFDEHWGRILHDGSVLVRTVVAGGAVAGHVLSFERDGEHFVGYWLGRAHWGKGIATRALATFLPLVPHRPLRATVTPHNVASRRVLEKCGFRVVGETRDAHGALVVLELDG